MKKKEEICKINWDAMSKKAHEMAAQHGFWDKEVTPEHCLCLVISELMEAVEADRKNIHTAAGVIEDLDPKDPDYDVIFKDRVKDTVEDELADTLIRLLDMAGAFDVSLKDMEEYEVSLAPNVSFAESVFWVVSKITTTYSYSSLIDTINYGFAYVLILAQMYGCENMLLHIAAKMRYNSGREKLHGKRY